MPKFHNIDQRSEEWFLLRAGKITGSALGAIMSGQETKGFKSAVNRLASERVHGVRMETDSFISNDMQRGIDLEDEAVSIFEEETFINISNGGFWEYSDTIGDSPDGNFNGGTLEVKCVKYNTIEEYFEKNKLPTTYKWQCQHHLLCSGTDTGYFMAYNELYKPFILEYGIDNELRDKMLTRFEKVNKLVNERMEFVKTLTK
jgi:putative phage-type endonuclease